MKTKGEGRRKKFKNVFARTFFSFFFLYFFFLYFFFLYFFPSFALDKILYQSGKRRNLERYVGKRQKERAKWNKMSGDEDEEREKTDFWSFKSLNPFLPLSSPFLFLHLSSSLSLPFLESYISVFLFPYLFHFCVFSVSCSCSLSLLLSLFLCFSLSFSISLLLTHSQSLEKKRGDFLPFSNSVFLMHLNCSDFLKEKEGRGRREKERDFERREKKETRQREEDIFKKPLFFSCSSWRETRREEEFERRKNEEKKNLNEESVGWQRHRQKILSWIYPWIYPWILSPKNGRYCQICHPKVAPPTGIHKFALIISSP